MSCAAGRVLLATLLILGIVAHTAPAAILPSGFQETIVFAGLTAPTAVAFSPDGRVFVAEKSGIIRLFSGLSDPTPAVFADLRTRVNDYWDRGLLGLALHPAFPAVPYVYVLYAHDAAIGGTAPLWGGFGTAFDGCPDPPGGNADGCVVSGRVSRLTASGDTWTGEEHVLVENWCQQYPSHSIGAIAFGTDGALYVSGGDGASFVFVDYGQRGHPLVNPCGDPPGGVGGSQSPPSAEGGALRSQDLRTSGDPTGYAGTVLRLDPITGAPFPDNPLVGGTALDDDPVIAYGLRNPFRMAVRPGSGDLWISDVGWDDWEELNRVADPADMVVENFGWPCYEGNLRQGSYDAFDFALCESLYAEPGAVTDAVFSYHHGERVVPDEACPVGTSAIAGLAFYGTGGYPASYAGALFFSDFSRSCIWSMLPGPNGEPDPATRATFASGVASPVDLKIGPGGDLYYVGLNGTVRRISYVAASQPPRAVLTASPTDGPLPLEVHFDGSASSDPDPGDTLAYAWDLDGDGDFDDSTAAAPSFTYGAAAAVQVRLRVTDPHGVSDVASVRITAGNSRPTATIGAPSASLAWSVGQVIAFNGSALDPEQGALGGDALTWRLVIRHCPSFTCHEHTVQTFTGASGQFTAPDHDYPTQLELRLTAVDAGGLSDTASVILDPATVELTFASNPPGLTLGVGSGSATAPVTQTAIVGSTVSVAAPAPQSLGGHSYAFVSWSDGGLQAHELVAPAGATTYTATFATTCGGGGCDDLNPCTVDGCHPQSGCTHTPIGDGTPCGDGLACNGDEICEGGVCTPGDGLQCDDGNLCTTDACDDEAPGGCVHTPSGIELAHARSVRISGLLTPGKQKLALRASLDLPTPFAPLLDPRLHGVGLELVDQAGTVRERLLLPAGALWKGNTSSTSFRYTDPDGAIGGIDSAQMRVVQTGEVSVKLRARNATFDLGLGDAPLTMRLRVGSVATQCGEYAFAGITSPGPRCRFNGSGSTLTCR